MENFPNEILEIIFSYIKNITKLKELKKFNSRFEKIIDYQLSKIKYFETFDFNKFTYNNRNDYYEIREYQKMKLINLSNCYFEKIKNLDILINLKSLFLYDYQNKNLPDSIGQLTNLQEIYITKNLEELPNSFENLINLQFLTISECDFTDIPEIVKKLKSLIQLNMRGNKIQNLYIENLNEIYLLNLSENKIKYVKNLLNAYIIIVDQETEEFFNSENVGNFLFLKKKTDNIGFIKYYSKKSKSHLISTNQILS